MAISEGIMATADMNLGSEETIHLDSVGISQDLVEDKVSIACQIFLLPHITTIQTKASAE